MMRKQFRPKRRNKIILLCGVIIGLLSMATYWGTVGAASYPHHNPSNAHTLQIGALPPSTAAGQQQDCVDCHPNILHSWDSSPHAHAYDDAEFMQRWESMGKPGECLACHTTGYQSTTNTFTAEGVQCEACHGEVMEGHPPAVVPVRADTDYCGVCHTTTLGEWRLTGHSTAGVGCVDCHDPHSQKPLFEKADDLCLNCHEHDMGPYLEDLHIQKGIGCVDCHALVIPPETVPEDGIVPTGHAFTITPATCVACHTDSLHAGFSLPGYENGAKATNGGEGQESGSEGATNASESAEESEVGEDSLTPEQHIQALEAALASTRLSTLFQGGIIGLVLGGLTVYYLGRNWRLSEEELQPDKQNDRTIVSDGDVIDRELERALTQIERGIEWGLNRWDRLKNWMRSRFQFRKQVKKAKKGSTRKPKTKNGSNNG